MLDDVEMKEGESPARPFAARVEVEAEGSEQNVKDGSERSGKEEEQGGTQDGKSDEGSKGGYRPIAQGAVARVRRRREREWRRRRGDSESEGEGVSLTALHVVRSADPSEL